MRFSEFTVSEVFQRFALAVFGDSLMLDQTRRLAAPLLYRCALTASDAGSVVKGEKKCQLNPGKFVEIAFQECLNSHKVCDPIFMYL